MPNRLLIVEDHPLFADALATILSSGMPSTSATIVGSLSEAKRTLEAGGRADLALVDLTLPDAHGLSAIIELRVSYPRLPLLAMSSSTGLDLMMLLAMCGTAGFVPKSSTRGDILGAVRRVLEGGTAFPEIGERPSGAGLGQRRGTETPVALTQKQLRVVQMLCQGLPNKQIGVVLGVEETTVKAHVSEVLRKLNVSSRTQAVLQFTKAGLGGGAVAFAHSGAGEPASRPMRSQ
jgi:DNA-binding NarL/FixJ family response regulator